jgi:hypothetical protein
MPAMDRRSVLEVPQQQGYHYGDGRSSSMGSDYHLNTPKPGSTTSMPDLCYAGGGCEHPTSRSGSQTTANNRGVKAKDTVHCAPILIEFNSRLTTAVQVVPYKTLNRPPSHRPQTNNVTLLKLQITTVEQSKKQNVPNKSLKQSDSPLGATPRLASLQSSHTWQRKKTKKKKNETAVRSNSVPCKKASVTKRDQRRSHRPPFSKLFFSLAGMFGASVKMESAPTIARSVRTILSGGGTSCSAVGVTWTVEARVLLVTHDASASLNCADPESGESGVNVDIGDSPGGTGNMATGSLRASSKGLASP